VIVLAGSYAETGKFADQLNERGIFHVVNRDKIRGLNPGVVHILPSFYDRRDFHALNAELERMKRNGAALQLIEWRKVDGRFVKADDVDVYREQVEPAVNPKKTPKPKTAISSPVTADITGVQADQLSGLRLMNEPKPAATDDDDFWAAIGASEAS
jgi:hypothetical protein